MEELTKEEQQRLGKYTHRYKALWDNHFWKLEAHVLELGSSTETCFSF